jgi:hypothetical protein
MFGLAARGAMQSKTVIGAFIHRIKADWVRQPPLTPALTSSLASSIA